MNLYPLQIVTPAGLYYDGQVQRLIIRTTEGDIGILARHTNLTAALLPGEVKLLTETGEEKKAFCTDGMLSIVNGTVRVVAGKFEWGEDIDAEQAKKDWEDSETALREVTPEHRWEVGSRTRAAEARYRASQK